MSQEQNNTCTDTSFEVRLPEFVSGSLSKQEQAEMLAHLDSCRSCNLSVLIMKGVAQSGRETLQVTEESTPQSDLSAHLTEQQVVALYASPDTLATEDRLSLERHLAGCPLCLREIEFLRSMESDMREARKPSSTTPAWSVVVMRKWLGFPRSAYAIAAIILLCTVVGSLWYPEREDEMWATGTQLRELQRNGGQLPVVVRESNQPLVKVIVPLPRHSDQSRYVATLHDSIRNQVDAVMTPHTDTSQSLSYIVDTRNLLDGEYDLQVMESGTSELSPAEFHFPFVLSTNP